MNLHRVVRVRVRISTAAAFVILASTGMAAAAQSDGSLEETYASQCAQHQDTQVCAALRDAMQANTRSLQAPPGMRSGGISTISPQEANYAARWGLYAEMAGKTYYSDHLGSEIVTEVSWTVPGEVLVSRSRGRGPSAKLLPNGMAIELRFDPTIGKVRTGPSTLDVQRDGSLVSLTSPTMRVRTVREADGAIVSYIEELQDGQWHTFDKTYGIIRQVEYTPSLQAALKARDDAATQRAATAAQRQENRGSTGLLGALAMATGAALAGGNAEHVMGAAMKGAELSTDNQMRRNVLAGQGDQMIAAGTQRMYEESAQRSASSPSSAQDMGPASRAASVSPPAPLPVALGHSAGAGNGPPIRFYYVVSLVPTANDTRNPLCVSNVVTLDARLDADPWGRRAKAAPLVEAYRDRFVAECSRLGRITSLGNLYYTIEGVDSGWPYPSFHPSDRKVTL